MNSKSEREREKMKIRYNRLVCFGKFKYVVLIWLASLVVLVCAPVAI
jgi:hypothetical protein